MSELIFIVYTSLSYQFLVSPFATLNNLNQTYELGDNVTFECNSTGGPGNTYQWQKDGFNQIGENSTHLELHQGVTALTGGTYSCVVLNDAGEHNASTHLFVAPYFLEQPVEGVFTSAGSTFNISCVAAAFPDPEYLWAREEGGEIRMENLVNESIFTITSIQYGEEGNYYCNVTSNGHVESSHRSLVTG